MHVACHVLKMTGLILETLPRNGKMRGWCVNMASCALSILLCMQGTDHWGTMRNLHVNVGQFTWLRGFIFDTYVTLMHQMSISESEVK